MKQNKTDTPRRRAVAGRCLLAGLLLCVGLAAAAAGDSPAERPFEPDVADDRAEHEAALDEICDRKAGYLVVESVPIVNTTHAAPLGERTDGVTQLACIEVPDFIDYDDWLAHWHGHHRRVAEETQSTYLYVRNVVVRALTDDAPGWAGIVEEGFPTAAMTDPTVWYAADGDQEKFQVNMARMLDSVEKFLDISRVETNPLSEYLLPVD